jgi:hypothetical protein
MIVYHVWHFVSHAPPEKARNSNDEPQDSSWYVMVVIVASKAPLWMEELEPFQGYYY